MPKGKKYKVKQGDCVSSLASKFGLTLKKIWDHPENSIYKRKRKDPNILYPGDIIFIPEKEEKKEDKSSKKKHVFKIENVPIKLRIRLLENGQPLKHSKYTLEIDGKKISNDSSETDKNGVLEHSIHPRAQKGTISTENEEFEFDLKLGHLDPVETTKGVQCRLFNLGHYRGKIDGELKSITKNALRNFQIKFSEELDVTGTIDDNTRKKLKEIHGN